MAVPKKKALIMVDLQNDFCKGGQLAVPNADEVIPLANQLQPYFDIVVATQDWHPPTHTSFASNHSPYTVGDMIVADNIPQILWPDHCVQHTKGADFHPNLNVRYLDKVIHKGIDKNIDSYSAFFDNAHRRSTGLGVYLQNKEISDVYIMGLATDYCVKYSSLDAKHLGFNVYVIQDACRGVNLKLGDVAAALQEISECGAKLVTVRDIIGEDKKQVAL
ncbi:MAG: bifunctional nicotinamidase/pyrazinamidase [Gammaproteobacteria bacterium]|nr:MAG: bifunctional nicotinamidase/pyrazinamidase [Gammaproteobacteria bacterium]